MDIGSVSNLVDRDLRYRPTKAAPQGLLLLAPTPYIPVPVDLRRLGYGPDAFKDASFIIGRGCVECRFTGYRGRVSVCELLILNELVKDALLCRKTSYEIRRISMETSGLVTLAEDGLIKAVGGNTSLQEVVRHLPRLHKPRPLNELRRLAGVN